jgi:hypothetical protein
MAEAPVDYDTGPTRGSCSLRPAEIQTSLGAKGRKQDGHRALAANFRDENVTACESVDAPTQLALNRP